MVKTFYILNDAYISGDGLPEHVFFRPSVGDFFISKEIYEVIAVYHTCTDGEHSIIVKIKLVKSNDKDKISC